MTSIAIIGSRGVPANYGGFETYVDNISRCLVKANAKVYVVNPHHRKIPGDKYEGVHILYAFDPEIYFRGRYIRGAMTILFDLFSMIMAILSRPDIMLVCGYASGPLLFLPKMFGIKLFVNPDGFEWKSSRWNKIVIWWLKFCEWCAVKASSELICDSKRIGEYFENSFKCDVSVIEYGSYFLEGDTPKPPQVGEKPYFLACARIVPETKIHEIIDAFKLVDTSAHLIIIGPKKDERYFREEIEPRLAGSDTVHYLGPIYEPGVLPKIRANSIALLHGHASDGTNPSLIESMGCGSVVVAIDRPSNRFPLPPGNDYFWQSPQDLKFKIEEVLKLSSAERQRIGELNRSRIKNDFSWDAKAKEHMDLFERKLNA